MKNEVLHIGPYAVDVIPRGDYTLYLIKRDGKAIRRQISRPSLADCQVDGMKQSEGFDVPAQKAVA